MRAMKINMKLKDDVKCGRVRAESIDMQEVSRFKPVHAAKKYGLHR